MKAVWTKSGGSPVTLGDVASKHFVEVQGIGGQAVEQVTPLFRATAPYRKMRGNISGELTLLVGISHASADTAATAFKTAHGMIGEDGSLVLTYKTTTTLTFAGATLRGVQTERINGVYWVLRYTFGITTIT